MKPKEITKDELAGAEAPVKPEKAPMTEQDKRKLLHDVKKILSSKPPPAPELETVTVRCDKQTRKWVIMAPNQPDRLMEEAIMIEVRFDVKYDPQKYIGCGLRGEYRGTATGKLVQPATKTSSVPPGAVRVAFCGQCGVFHPKAEGCQVQLKEVDFLILHKECKADVVLKK